MKKLRLLLKVFALIIITIFLLLTAAGCMVDTPLYLISDTPGQFVSRYDAGAVISLNYTVRSVLHADEYRITCSGENITLLSSAECIAKEGDGYRLDFHVPENGEGKITLTITPFSSGEMPYGEAHSYLYWSSCDLGVFLSEYMETYPKLAMAKAQFDAHEITSADYYHIAKELPFQMDIGLMNAFGQVASGKSEHSCYAAPYIEAVNNHIFGISAGIDVPDVLIACIILVFFYFKFRKLSRRRAH